MMAVEESALALADSNVIKDSVVPRQIVLETTAEIRAGFHVSATTGIAIQILVVVVQPAYTKIFVILQLETH